MREGKRGGEGKMRQGEKGILKSGELYVNYCSKLLK